MKGARVRSVGAVVGAVLASLRATLALECGLLFVAGALLARSAALLSSVEEGTGAVMLLCGALCAAAWWLEHPLARAATARVLDQRLGHHGALQTAFELEQRAALAPGLNPMEELVCARVLARLRFAAALKAAFPSFFLPLGAPVAAALLWLWVVDSRSALPPAAHDLGALTAGLERTLADPEFAARAAQPGNEAEPWRLVLREVQELSAALAENALASADPKAGASEAMRVRLERLDQRLAELAPRLEPADALHRRLDEARTWLDALATALGARSGASADPLLDGTRAASLTRDRSDGTISRPLPAPGPGVPPPMPPPTAPDPAALPPGSAEVALGVQAGSFWPAEYDGVVARWIELSRSARDESQR